MVSDVGIWYVNTSVFAVLTGADKEYSVLILFIPVKAKIVN